MESTLDKLKMYERAKIKNILCDKETKNRLLDIGLTYNTSIECVLETKKGEMKAYDIRGGIIALRKEDASKIKILY